MIVFPNGKINLGLNIVGKRADGFHNLETVFFPVMIKDVLEIVEAKDLSFSSSGLAIPGDSVNNICMKAYRLLSRDIELPGVHIHLHKNIPIGAGLGGGSADASFFIMLMNEKFDLSLSQDRMEKYASQLGSDCPFFIRNQPVYASGTGDKFESIGFELSNYFIVVVMPKVQVVTTVAFSGVTPSPSANLRELITNNVFEWKETITNDFEPGIIKRYPEIGSIKNSLYSSGAIYASMSGSGSAVFGIFDAPIELAELEKGNRVFYGV